MTHPRWAQVVVAAVGLSLLFGTDAAGRQAGGTPPASSDTRNTTVEQSCAGVEAYLTARSQILLEREDVLARASNPGSIDARTALEVSTTLAEVSVEIGKLEPPPVLNNYHRTSIVGFDALSDTFAAISEGGISGAVDEIEAQRAPLDEMSAAEEIAMAECPAEWVTVADLEATPAAHTHHSSAVSR